MVSLSKEGKQMKRSRLSQAGRGHVSIRGRKKALRYEAHLERGLYKALHELQRLQAVRHGQDVPAPAALDITTDLAREREPGSQAK